MSMAFSERFSGVRRAQQLAEHSLSLLEAELHPGMMERDAAACLRDICLSHAGVQQALTDMVLSGPNSAGFHDFASDREIEPGDLILIDFSLVADGWYSDMTRVFSLGPPPEEARRICAVTALAKERAASLLRPGVTGAELYRAAKGVLARHGYGDCFPHALGHGIGHEMHQPPSLCAGCEAPIPMGTVFSIEPGVYLPGRFGARLEDLYYLDEGGAVCLNQTPAVLKILPLHSK